MFGREAPSVGSLLSQPPVSDDPSFGEEARRTMRNALKVAYNSIIRRQEDAHRQQQTENKSLSFQPFSVGEEVLLLDHAT